MLDHMLITRNLRAHYRGSEIHNELCMTSRRPSRWKPSTRSRITRRRLAGRQYDGDIETKRLSTWELLPDRVRSALAVGWRQGVPADATALYTRWWQLETWLRDVTYVELRSRDGITWADALPTNAEQRESGDQSQRHMRTPDSHARLAYLDTGPLFDLLDKNWTLFEHALLDDQAVWGGRVVKLRKIRNRIGHCRRPHPDDLARVEQTLRDLDSAAFDTVASYNRQHHPDPSLPDPIVEAWVRCGHPDAKRLVRHADHQDNVGFELRYSRRPWAERRPTGAAISGSTGYLWHAAWYLGRTELEPRRWWEDNRLDPHRDLVVWAGFSNSSAVEVSFAAVDDPQQIANAIGACFDAVLVNDSPRTQGEYTSVNDIDDAYEAWITANRDLDPRLQIASAWTIVDDTTTPITMFGA